MSNYNAPNKAQDDQFTWQEHNNLKAAVNSKMDAEKMVQTLASPQNNEFPSSTAITNYLTQNFTPSANSFGYNGELSGSEDILANSFTKSGFWLPKVAFVATAHSSYPVNKLGKLDCYKNTNFTTWQYTTIEAVPILFVCTKKPSESPSAWIQLVSVNYLTTNNYCQCAVLGIPITSVEDSISSAGSDYTVSNLTSETNWKSATLEVSKTGIGLNVGDSARILIRFSGDALLGKTATVSGYGEKVCDFMIDEINNEDLIIRAYNFTSETAVNNFQLTYSIN